MTRLVKMTGDSRWWRDVVESVAGQRWLLAVVILHCLLDLTPEGVIFSAHNSASSREKGWPVFMVCSQTAQFRCFYKTTNWSPGCFTDVLTVAFPAQCGVKNPQMTQIHHHQPYLNHDKDLEIPPPHPTLSFLTVMWLIFMWPWPLHSEHGRSEWLKHLSFERMTVRMHSCR